MLCTWLSCVHSTKHSILSISLGLAIKNSTFDCPRKQKLIESHIKIPTIKLKIIILHLLKAYMFSTCFVELYT